jgi:hypothetical protein
LGNFQVTALCACLGGAINVFDVTPNEDINRWQSNEHSPVGVFWYDAADLTDYDDIQYNKQKALNQSKIFGLVLNSVLFNLY